MDIKSIPRIDTFGFDWQANLQGAQAISTHHYSNLCAGVAHIPQVINTYGLEVDDTLHTAVIISLFSDARSPDFERLPHNADDKRGWVGSEFMNDSRADWGSLLWLLYYSKIVDEIPLKAQATCLEALNWLIEDDIVHQVQVDCYWHKKSQSESVLAIKVRIYQSQQFDPVYNVLWGLTIAKARHEVS